jgi:hypothetical protein
MAIAASEVLIHGQVRVEDLKLAQSLDLMVGIQFSGLGCDQSLGLEHRFLCPNSLKVWIIRNDALQVESLAWQNAWLIGWRNLIARRELKIEWGCGLGSTLCRRAGNYH